MDVLEHLARAPAPQAGFASLTDWLDHLARAPRAGDELDDALLSGFEADRLGYAFVGGYEAALRRLVSRASATSAPRPRVSLAATERGGAHPRAITTTLRTTGSSDGELVLDGEKTFATLASVADELLVVASRGVGPDGKNRLAVVRVPATAAGLTIEPRPPTPFAPEIPHARVALAGVRVRDADVLPGDGYADWLKPFRTIEDLHVLGASLGHVIRSARIFGFAPAVLEQALALAVAVRGLAEMRPDDPVAHVALAGVFDGVRRLVHEHDAEWDKADDATRDRWRRDLALLTVADAARQARTAAAFTALAAQPPR